MITRNHGRGASHDVEISAGSDHGKVERSDCAGIKNPTVELCSSKNGKRSDRTVIFNGMSSAADDARVDDGSDGASAIVIDARSRASDGSTVVDRTVS